MDYFFYCTLVYYLQKKEARTKSASPISSQSKNSKTGISGLGIKEGEAASTTTSMVDISADEGEDGHLMGDDANFDSSDENISSVEEEIRRIDLSLEKLQMELEKQRDIDMAGFGR